MASTVSNGNDRSEKWQRPFTKGKFALPTLTSIINTSFATRILSCSWKMAEVSPLLKDGDFEDPNNYRRISPLPIMSKICERISLHQLMPYLLSNERLSATQSGNKKFHSTETSLIYTTEAILGGIDKKKLTAVVLLDMSKAFDSIINNYSMSARWI